MRSAALTDQNSAQPGFHRSSLWRLFGFLKPRRFQYFATMFVVAAIYAAERMFTGLIILWFTNAIVEQDLQLLIQTVLYWLAFFVVMTIILLPFLYYWRASIVHGAANLRQAVFSHLQRLPLGYFERRHSGEAMSILSNDVSLAEQAYQDSIFSLVQAIFISVGSIGLMLYLQWDLAVLILVVGLYPLVANTLAARPLRRVGDETLAQQSVVSERLSDLLAGFQVVRTFSLGAWILERFTKSNHILLNANLKRVGIESTLAASNEFGILLMVLPYIYGALLVLQGKTTLGVFMGLVQLNGSVQYLFTTLGNVISQIQGSLAATDRILIVLDTPIEPQRYPAIEAERALPEVVPAPPEIQPLIAFHDVYFSYSDQLPILQGMSFTIQPGQRVALVGASGGGKSTIFRLLLGYYPAQSGQIDVMGKPLHAFTLSDLRDQFAYVPQDAFLYAGTILENIRYGKADASEEQVIEVARASIADEFIREFADGYQARVGERGARLSGGQRQRIAIARALLKNAPILLLDEATSALDSESEALVQQALETLMHGRTTIAIAHRLSTIEGADCIFVVEAGRVIEQGRHQDLLAAGGTYRRLYDLQFRDNG